MRSAHRPDARSSPRLRTAPWAGSSPTGGPRWHSPASSTASTPTAWPCGDSPWAGALPGRAEGCCCACWQSEGISMRSSHGLRGNFTCLALTVVRDAGDFFRRVSGLQAHSPVWFPAWLPCGGRIPARHLPPRPWSLCAALHGFASVRDDRANVMRPLRFPAPPSSLLGLDRAPAAFAGLSGDVGKVIFPRMLVALGEVGIGKLPAFRSRYSSAVVCIRRSSAVLPRASR